MSIKKNAFSLFAVGFLFLVFFGVMSLYKSDTVHPIWTEELKLERDEKEEIIQTIDNLSKRYSLEKETVDGPGKLEGRAVHFYHYKHNDRIVMTVHDLKADGTILAVYFYGLEDKSEDDSLSSNIRPLLNQQP